LLEIQRRKDMIASAMSDIDNESFSEDPRKVKSHSSGSESGSSSGEYESEEDDEADDGFYQTERGLLTNKPSKLEMMIEKQPRIKIKKNKHHRADDEELPPAMRDDSEDYELEAIQEESKV
jgi:hypothetical protein